MNKAELLNTLDDIKEYFYECAGNASFNSAAERKFRKYIEAIADVRDMVSIDNGCSDSCPIEGVE